MQDYFKSLMYTNDTVLLLGRTTGSGQLCFTKHGTIQYCQNNDIGLNQSKTKQLIVGRQKECTQRLPELEEVTLPNIVTLHWTTDYNGHHT